MKNRSSIKHFLHKYKVSLLWGFSLLFFIVSFIQLNFITVDRQVRKVERAVQKREKILDYYMTKALNTPNDRWLPFEKFPDDMVIYKYVDNNIQSWINEFPISNDEIKILDSWYRIHDLNNTSILNTPLAFLLDEIQYVNLGPSWYIVKIRTDQEKNSVVIAGFKIKTEYANENTLLKNSTNPHLNISARFTTTPLFVDNSNIICSKNGTPLFSLTSSNPIPGHKDTLPLRWLSFLFAIVAMFVFQARHRDYKSCLLTIVGMAVIQIATYMMIDDISDSIEIFSPMLYAGGDIIDSLGKMLLSHLFLFLYASSVFISRNDIIRHVASHRPWRRHADIAITVLLLIGSLVYTHFTLFSIIKNSNIVLDIYRINMISKYSIIVYVSYALLFFSILLMLYMLCAFLRFNRKRRSRHRVNILSTKFIIAYITAISLYTTIFVSVVAFRKEYDNLKILTGRFAVERDLTLEIQLQAIEQHIVNDPLIKRIAGLPNTEGMILNRLSERYFWNIFQNYDLKITICGEQDRIITDEYPHPTNCYRYFSEIIDRYGVRLSPQSAFFYLDYFKNRISYLGAFNIYRGNTRYDLYIEIDSKRGQDDLGYPSLLTNDNNLSTSKLPFPYSLAKYHNGKITSHQGQYNFPVSFPIDSLQDGFSYFVHNNSFHFMNKVSSNNLIVINRPNRDIFLYLIFLSYTFLFFGLMAFLLSRLIIQKRHLPHLNIPLHSFRRKITFLLTTSMVVALIFMAIGSVVLILKYMNNNNRSTMEEKLASVQSNLTKIAKTSERYEELNSINVFTTMDLISKNNQVDINLFDPTGKLIRTTRPEVFNEYLVSARMNSEAYYKLIHQKRMQVVQEETISTLKYYSLYTPIYNDNGAILAIANLPYFVNDNLFKYDASSIVAAIINLYMLLMIAALLIGYAMSNSVSKPLKEISKSMQEIDITHKVEHINYRENDELGMLVKTYNKMIDDLEQSTKVLAQSEREQAWREMARQIAHEIKNPLTPMKLSIQHMVRMKRQGVEGWEKRFEPLAASLIEQIDILSNTASEFSSFAKFYNEDVTEIDLVGIIREQYVLFDNNDNIRIEFRSDLQHAETMARKSQITRAFVNLISNAIQALEDKEDGRIRISLRQSGEYYEVSIEDNGKGVSEDNLPKLFTPNFTTKTRGTGLGLAICKNIVVQSRGEIFYKQSRELGGADFTVLLPRHADFDETDRLDT